MSDMTHQADNSGEDCGQKKVRCKSLVVDGGKYRTLLTKKYENRRKWEKPNPKQIYTYIPGTVREIFVSSGDRVKAGDKMLILEAMKMYNTIEVPADGIVKKVHVSSNDRLPKGHLIVEFE